MALSYDISPTERHKTDMSDSSPEYGQKGQDMTEPTNTTEPTIESIAAEWPGLDIEDIAGVRDVWLACNESIAYCVAWYLRAKRCGDADMAAEYAEIAHKPHLYADTYSQDELDKFVALRLK
jgi:hypothetical protein